MIRLCQLKRKSNNIYACFYYENDRNNSVRRVIEIDSIDGNAFNARLAYAFEMKHHKAYYVSFERNDYISIYSTFDNRNKLIEKCYDEMIYLLACIS